MVRLIYQDILIISKYFAGGINDMKKLILLLLFIPLVSFGQEKVTEQEEEEEEISYCNPDNRQMTGEIITSNPVFPGCENLPNSQRRSCFQEKMTNHINSELRYPEQALEKDLEGKVTIEFFLEKDGRFVICETIGPYKILEKEARRIILSLPKCKPAEINGRTVRVPFSMPITFKLGRNEKQERPEKSYWFDKGYSAFNANDFDQAILYYTKHLNLFPNDANAYMKRSYAKKELENFEGSIKDIDLAIKISIAQGDDNNSLSWLYLERGILKYNLNDYNGAVEDYNKYINYYYTGEAYYLRGKAKYFLKEYNDAINDFNEALSVSYEKVEPTLLLLLGNSKFHLKNYREAILDYNKAFFANSDRSFRHTVVSYRARSKKEIKDYEGAKVDYSLMIGLKPEDPDGYFLAVDAILPMNDIINFFDALTNNKNELSNIKKPAIEEEGLNEVIWYLTEFVSIVNPEICTNCNEGSPTDKAVALGVIAFSKFLLMDYEDACRYAKESTLLGFDASEIINLTCKNSLNKS